MWCKFFDCWFGSALRLLANPLGRLCKDTDVLTFVCYSLYDYWLPMYINGNFKKYTLVDLILIQEPGSSSPQPKSFTFYILTIAFMSSLIPTSCTYNGSPYVQLSMACNIQFDCLLFKFPILLNLCKTQHSRPPRDTATQKCFYWMYRYAVYPH